MLLIGGDTDVWKKALRTEICEEELKRRTGLFISSVLSEDKRATVNSSGSDRLRATDMLVWYGMATAG